MGRTWTRPELVQARKILAELYGTQRAITTVLKDADINPGRVDLSGGAVQVWATALDEANKSYSVDALIEAVLAEHPTRDDLRALMRAQPPGTPPTAAGPGPKPKPVTQAAPSSPTTWTVASAPSGSFAKLSGPQWRTLQEALADAFPSERELQLLVKFHFGENLARIVSGGNLGGTVFDLIQWSQARGWTERLFLAARAERPDHAGLAGFGLLVAPAAGAGRAATAPLAGSTLERVLRADVPNFKLADFLAKLGVIQSQVCRIEIGGRAKGTGFLVGPSCVMTNYHVMQPLFESGVAPSQVVVRFGYHGGGGREVRLAGAWDVAHSPYAPFEATAPGTDVPAEDQLDYAVVRLDAPAGAAPADDKSSSNAPERGWIKLPEDSPSLLADAPLLIVQHPQGRSMEVAIETRGVDSFNANRTRVKHRVNTDGGSSGSPVFNFDCALVALHHAGDAAALPVFNEAVPINAIRKDLARLGVLDALKD